MMERISREWRRDRLRDGMAKLPRISMFPTMMTIVFGGAVGLLVSEVVEIDGDLAFSHLCDVVLGDNVDDKHAKYYLQCHPTTTCSLGRNLNILIWMHPNWK